MASSRMAGRRDEESRADVLHTSYERTSSPGNERIANACRAAFIFCLPGDIACLHPNHFASI